MRQVTLTKELGRTLVTTTTAAATGNSGYLDMPAHVIGGTFFVDVTAASGTSPTLDISIATPVGSTASPVDVVCFRFTQITTAADNELKVMFGPTATSDTDQWQVTNSSALAATGGLAATPHPITDRIKITWTIGGTNPSFTFAVYFIPWRNINGGYR